MKTIAPGSPAAFVDSSTATTSHPRGSASADNKRIHIRFDKLFPILVGSETFGDTIGVARNISVGGMLIEMAFPLPLGSVVTVHFQVDREDGTVDELIARCEVKHHYCLNYSRLGAGTSEPASARAIGLRFVDFDDRPSLDTLTSARWLH